MSMTIKTHHVSITKSMKDYVEKKLGKLDRYFANIQDIIVDLNVSDNSAIDDRHTVSATVWVPGSVFRAKKKTRDMYASVDFVFEKLEKQLKKFKEKIKEHNRHGENRNITRSLEEAFTELEVEETVTDSTPTYYIRKPMYSDDARILLEEKQWPFLMFHNAETEQINVAHETESGEF